MIQGGKMICSTKYSKLGAKQKFRLSVAVCWSTHSVAVLSTSVLLTSALSTAVLSTALFASWWAKRRTCSVGLGWTGVGTSSLWMGRLGWIFPQILVMLAFGAGEETLGGLGLAGRSAIRKRRAMFIQKNPVKHEHAKVLMSFSVPQSQSTMLSGV